MSRDEIKKQRMNVFKVFMRLFPMVFKAYPSWFFLSQILSIIHGVSWGLITLFTQRFFDTASMLAAGNIELSHAVVSLVFMGLAHFFSQLLNGISNFVPQVYADKVIGKLQLIINDKMSRIPPVCFENTELLDDINKANGGKNNAVWFVITFTFVFTFYIPYFVFMSFYLFSLKPILAISIVIVFIPTLLTQIIRSRVYARLEDKSAPVRRQYDYYENCMVGREYFKETRLLGGFKFFIKLYKDALVLLNELSWKANLRTNIYEMLMKLLTLTGYLGILYMLFSALMNREISVGAFTAVFASMGMLFHIMEEVVCDHFGRIAQNLGTIQNFLNFMDIPEQKGDDLQIDPNSDIVINNVSFSYPLAENKAVKNATFIIKNGETIAIVGENGSGKSTLVRLITGLYLPVEGDITYGSVNTKDIIPGNIYKNISGVFQRFQKYQMTLKENISISDTGKEPEKKHLDKVSEEAGLDINDKSFDKGYETMLSREFDGVDLSGGQWQRIAIARGFYRSHNIIVLDEPTAAIDPFEETKIYNRFAEISRDKTAIIVTHRLGSVKLADRIVVMDRGEVVDVGTHSDLLKRCRKYNEMWNAQAQYYK